MNPKRVSGSFRFIYHIGIHSIRVYVPLLIRVIWFLRFGQLVLYLCGND